MSSDEATGTGQVTTSAIETHVPGDPAAFHDLATYLRSGLGANVEALGDEAAARRSRLADSWLGAAGEAFGQRASTLTSACDGTHATVTPIATHIDTLGATLSSTQDGLAALLAQAPAWGLRVEGTRIHPATDTFMDFDAPGGLTLQPLDVLMSKLEAWNSVAERAEALWKQWYDAVNEMGANADLGASDLISVLSDLISVGSTRGLKGVASRIWSKQADWLRELSASQKAHAAALTDYIAKTGDESAKYEHNQRWIEAVDSRYAAEAADELAKDPPLPRGINVGLGSLTALATGVGIYSDVQDGESVTQATVSQGAGLAAGVGAAVIAGGVAGSFAPGPGTLAGAVVVGGTELVVGTATAIGIDQAIDWAWPGDDGGGDESPSIADQYGGTLLGSAEQVTTPEPAPGEGVTP